MSKQLYSTKRIAIKNNNFSETNQRQNYQCPGLYESQVPNNTSEK